ncbi:MAG: flagellar protein FliT [Methylophagaceae bacterium]
MAPSQSQQILSDLSQVLMLTKSMQQKAQQQVWAELSNLEQQRQLIIEGVFPIADKLANDDVRNMVQQIIDLNQQLEIVCQQEKQDLQVQLQSFNHNKKVTAAYTSV